MTKDDPPKNSVTVSIAGDEHTIRSSAAPEYTRSCAKLVNQRIQEIRRRSSGVLEPHKAAILAALSLTDELLQAQAELETVREDVVERADVLVKRIQGELTATSDE